MSKYQAFTPVSKANRRWPDKVITKAPLWCSVDLRDGNQALVNPMSVDQKIEMFDLLVKLGFKHIEIGFPSASQIEFDFARRLVDEKRIPDGVSIQVLCQAREHLVERTIESLKGCKTAVFHIYNSTSPAHREYTFGLSKEDILDVAVKGVAMVKSRLALLPETAVTLEYSPESYSQTEPEYAVEVCKAVHEAWGTEKSIIFNLPATVEVCTPNQHADQIEWFLDHIPHRDKVILSLHTHNDRGTGVAAAEMAVLAGADRVEGTLFGNGERTGNLDMVTMGLNMYTQGVDPEIDYSDLPGIVEAYERLTGMQVHPRHPYAGDLVFTAFSGSHQDAIKKGLEKRNNKVAKAGDHAVAWDVPYLPIDPKDIGRTYEAIIRINSQSGKGGVAWILKERQGLDLPKAMHPEIGRIVNEHADRIGKELAPEVIWEIFQEEYLKVLSPIRVLHFHGESYDEAKNLTTIDAELEIKSSTVRISSSGSGPLDALSQGIAEAGYKGFAVEDFHEAAIGSGAEARAAAFVRITKPIKGSSRKQEFWGVGIHRSITTAGLEALVSAINRAFKE